MEKEAEIQKTILEYLKFKNIFHWRQNSGAVPITTGIKRQFVSFGIPGAPDIFVVSYGRIYGLEVKSEKGRQNDNQKAFQERFERAGGLYFLVRSLDDVFKISL